MVKILLMVAGLLSISPSFGAGSYRVLDVKGNANFVDQKNNSKNIFLGNFIPENVTVSVATGSQLTLEYFDGTKFFISGNSNIELKEKIILIEGTVWYQSKQDKVSKVFETVNGLLEVKKADVVLDYLPSIKKSQVFVLSGNATFANVFAPERKELLVSGEISFIQKDFQQGAPRRPTVIGKESLMAVIKKFKDVSPSDEDFNNLMHSLAGEKNTNREIASTTEKTQERVNATSNSDEGIYFIPKNFSAPKRDHPKKTFTSRSVASIKKVEAKCPCEKKYVTSIKKIAIKEYNFPVKYDNSSPMHAQEVMRIPAAEKTSELDMLKNELEKVSSETNNVY
jgi:hypothetical protein